MELRGQRAQPPTVKLALERLQDLERQLKDNGICFGHGSIRQIAEGVSQLEEARRGIHEILEVETIEASKLRYKLSELPNKLRQQIAAAVAAARESKTTHLNELKAKIKMLTQQLEALGKEYCRLEQENASLCPVQHEAEARYNDIIFLMNNVMGDRANKQITLNETYDSIRDMKQKIVNVNSDIADLKEEMDVKRNEYNIRKKSLTAKFTEIYELVQDQNKINFEKKNKLDDLKMELHKFNENLLVQEEKTAQLRLQNAVLKKQEAVFQNEHNEKSKAFEELNKKKDKLTDELHTLIEYYKNEIEYLQTKSLQVQRNINNAEVLNQGLAVRRKSRNEAAAKAKDHEIEMRKRLQSLTERLDSVKDMLIQTDKNLLSTRKEIQELEEMMLNLADKHKDTMEFLNAELQKYAHKLEKEKQLRHAAQLTREEIANEMLDIKETTEAHLTNLSKHLQELRRKRARLIVENKNLQKNIDEYAGKIANLKQQIAAEENTFKNMEKHLSAEIKQLKNEIKEIKEKMMQVKKELEIKLTIQQKLETEFADETAICDKLQKEHNDYISMKYDLANTISRLKRETGILLVTKPDLISMLSSIRNNTLHQVKNTAKQLKLVEVDIYEADRRLEIVETENCKLKLCNFQLTKDLASLGEEGERQKAEKENQDNELQILYDYLNNSWALNFSVQKEFAACDQCVLNAIEKLMNKIQLREMKLGSIGDQLKEHLSKLLSFVGSTNSAERTKEKCMIKQTIPLQ